MDVSAISVNYNTGHVIGETIASVAGQQGVSVEMLIVDNASPDQSAAQIRALACPNLTVIENPENTGFGAGNNTGARVAQGDYLLMINPDARFTTPHDLRRLVDWMNQHPECGLCGATLLHNGQRTGPKLDYPGDRNIQRTWNLPPGAAWIAGAFMLARRSAFEQIGGFDEDFFLYSEEIDLGLRMRLAGYTVGFVDEVEIAHIGAVSETNSDRYDYWRRRTDSRFLFLRKHYAAELCRRQFKREKRRAAFRVWMRSLAKGPKQTLYRAIRDSAAAALAELDRSGGKGRPKPV